MSRKEIREKQKKIRRKRIIKLILILLLLVIIIVGTIYLCKNYFTEYQEKKDYDKLVQFMQETDNSEEIENVENQKIEKLWKLNEYNNEIVGWLEINGTNIQYPVLQTTNNSYYVDHNYKKEYSSNGSLFLDKNVDLKLPSSNFLIYGHRNKNGAMFEDLLKYEKEEFYQEHKTIRFVTLEEDATYEILAVFRSRIYYQSETNVFRYYYFINAETEEKYNEYVSNAKAISLYDTGVTASYGDQLLTLSTCEYSQDNGRFAVVAKKIS